MDTLGNLIDKLFTINLKMHYYKDGKKFLDLNRQKDLLINEIVDLNNELEKIGDDMIREQHKTY